MKIEDADLPHIYMLDPYSHTAVPYPDKLDSV